MRFLERRVEHVPVEDGGERVPVRNMEAGVGTDHHVHVQRIDVVAEEAVAHPSLDDLLEQGDGRDVLPQDRVGLSQVLGAMDVLDADELDELRVRRVVVVRRLRERSQRLVR